MLEGHASLACQLFSFLSLYRRARLFLYFMMHFSQTKEFLRSNRKTLTVFCLLLAGKEQKEASTSSPPSTSSSFMRKDGGAEVCSLPWMLLALLGSAVQKGVPLLCCSIPHTREALRPHRYHPSVAVRTKPWELPQILWYLQKEEGSMQTDTAILPTYIVHTGIFNRLLLKELKVRIKTHPAEVYNHNTQPYRSKSCFNLNIYAHI